MAHSTPRQIGLVPLPASTACQGHSLHETQNAPRPATAQQWQLTVLYSVRAKNTKLRAGNWDRVQYRPVRQTRLGEWTAERIAPPCCAVVDSRWQGVDRAHRFPQLWRKAAGPQPR